jgi:hypothetical protein
MMVTTLIDIDRVTKDKKLRKKLKELIGLFQFIRESSGSCGKIPIDEIGW